MDSIKKILGKETGINEKEIVLELPPKGFGDWAFPCFLLSKKLKKRPEDIAKELQKIKLPKEIEKVQAQGPYLNFYMNKDLAVANLVKEYNTKFKKKGKAIIEHTSINPNAPPHVGRARNSIIGDSLVRILREYGYQTEVHYLVNNVGKQIAMLVYGLKGKNPLSIKFEDYLELYTGVNREIESNPEKEKEIFALIKKFEDGDKKTVKLFNDVVKVCMEGQVGLLGELGIKFDKFDYESDFIKDSEKILKKLPIQKDEEEREIIDLKEENLPMKDPRLVIKRSDGTYLYIVKDLPYTVYKVGLGGELNIVVLGEDHKLYFQQLSAMLRMSGYKPPEVVHYSFILLPAGKMSTRKGDVVLLSDFMNECANKSKEELSKRYDDVPEELVKEIAYGALKYSILKVSPEKNVIFRWEEALDFNGNASPYVQYSVVRAKRILEKSEKKEKVSKFEKVSDEEYQMIKKIVSSKAIIEESALKRKPHLLVNYCFEAAKEFNEFYEKCPVIGSESEEKRIKIVQMYYETMSKCLDLLGITVPSKM